MAYRKLTQEVIDTIVSELLTQSMQPRHVFGSIGFRYRMFSVRSVCKKAGISHTTFYRWIRAYRLIKWRERQLTDAEQQVLSFGDAIEAVIDRLIDDVSAEALAALLFGDIFSEIEGIDTTETPEASDPSAWEDLTEALTEGIRLVEFDVPNFTKKHVE